MTAFERLLARPHGPHDPETFELDLALRMGPCAGKLVLVALAPGRFALARLPALRHAPVELLGPEYATTLDGERDILTRRMAARP